MMKRNLLVVAGTAALGISLIALPGHSTQAQSAAENSVTSLKREIAELKARLAEAQEEQEFAGPVIAEAPEVGPEVEIERQLIDFQEPEGPVAPPAPSAHRLVMSLDGDGGSWLGVETQEVGSEKAKTLKLSSERGALIGKVLPDSPAAKAGLKENDVVTEINGQRVEGTDPRNSRRTHRTTFRLARRQTTNHHRDARQVRRAPQRHDESFATGVRIPRAGNAGNP
jgi:hypothetical protein